MIIFRQHKGTLAESLAESKEFESMEKMKEHIVEFLHEGWEGSEERCTVNDIVINENLARKDDRIGWEDTMHVCIKRKGDEDYVQKYGHAICIGFCATKYDAHHIIQAKH